MSAEVIEAILCVETQLERIADSLEKLEKAAIVHGVQFVDERNEHGVQFVDERNEHGVQFVDERNEHGVQFDSKIKIVGINQTEEWRRKGWEDEK